MSDFIVSLLADMAEGAVTGAARARAKRSPENVRTAPVHVQPWTPPELPAPAASPRPPEPAIAPPAPAPAPALPAKPVPVRSPDRLGIRRLFATRADVLHTVLAAEILGPPVALREDNLLRRTGV